MEALANASHTEAAEAAALPPRRWFSEPGKIVHAHTVQGQVANRMDPITHTHTRTRTCGRVVLFQDFAGRRCIGGTRWCVREAARRNWCYGGLEHSLVPVAAPVAAGPRPAGHAVAGSVAVVVLLGLAVGPVFIFALALFAFALPVGGRRVLGGGRAKRGRKGARVGVERAGHGW